MSGRASVKKGLALYDREIPALYLRFMEIGEVAMTEELLQFSEGDIRAVILDYAKDGTIMGIELLLNPNSRLKRALDQSFRGEARE